MSGRPLPVATFFVFSKPLCSLFAAQIVIREFSAPLQKRCLSLSKGFPLQPALLEFFWKAVEDALQYVKMYVAGAA